MGWIDTPLGRVLLRRKHTLPVILFVYDAGAPSMSELIRCVRGHPKSVINTVRALERLGVLSRVRMSGGHHIVETRLTLRGIQLVETPIYRWRNLLRKWDRMHD